MDQNQKTYHRIKGVSAWLFLSRAAKVVEARARRSVASTGLCLSDFGVLEVLLHRGPLSVSEIGKRILISSGSTTTSIDRLEREGLVRREMEGPDRRTRTVHLTETGRRLIEEHFNAHKQDMELAFTQLTDAEMAALLPILGKIAHTGGDPSDDPEETGGE